MPDNEAQLAMTRRGSRTFKGAGRQHLSEQHHIGSHMSAAIDARGIDVPVARCRVGIAGRLQRIGLLVLKECPNGG